MSQDIWKNILEVLTEKEEEDNRHGNERKWRLKIKTVEKQDTREDKELQGK